MQIVYSEAQLMHAPHRFLVRGEWRPCPEKPERARLLLEAVQAASPAHTIVTPPLRDGLPDQAPIAAVHDAAYLDFLRTAHDRWRALEGAGDLVTPNMHPRNRTDGYPKSVVGQAGFHMADTACPIGPETWLAIQASAATAIHAARLVMDGADAAYALCRPPGHHAFADMAGGFCYLNNTAIAAQLLRQLAKRVAIIDVDLHHGNGTQGIFYQRGDVFTISIHADPSQFYPFFYGYADETGAGEGLGRNANLPLPLGSDDKTFLAALDQAVGLLAEFRPEALVIALGLDAFVNDPLAGLQVTEAGFRRIGARLGAIALPTVLVQEGGYPCPELGSNLLAVLEGFAEGRQAGA
ncbi:MAG: histone deacetylase family protein [Dongiaceae bacterium]